MFNVTLNDIANAVPVFKELSTKSFMGSVSFKIAKLIRELDKELVTLNETHQQIIAECSETDENGNVKIREDKVQEYNEKMNEILSTNCEIYAERLPEECFNDIEITPNQTSAILNFIE